MFKLLSLRGAALLLLLLSATTTVGCDPRKNVVWLPDSSGFIYFKEEQIFHLDLAAKKNHVVVKDTGIQTIWPAISPDGKQFAVTRHDAKESAVEIIIYDLAGKVNQRTKLEHLREEAPSGLFWSPGGKHIVVASDRDTILYDVKERTVVRWERSLPLPIGGTPFRPDGNGLLIIKGLKWIDLDRLDGDDTRIVFVDLMGKEREVMLPKEKIRDKELKAEMCLLAALIDSTWKGDVATGLGFSIDTATLKCSLDEKAVKDIDKDLPLGFLMPESKLRLTGRFFISSFSFDAELTDSKSNKATSVFSDCKHFMFTPSPDRKHLAVRHGDDDRIAVINAKGEIIWKSPEP